MSIEPLERAASLDEERIQLLKDQFPEIWADGKINVEALTDALSDVIEDDEAAVEHYGLSWPGKRMARRLATQAATGTLHPLLGEGIDEDKTKNIFIEGENLEVLRILKKSYPGKIKMIYIDPPYNTGGDFIYKDDYSESVESYLRRSGQSDEAGLLTSNPKSSGRYHTNWLNMLYPRLKLARELLRDDGVIFVSIDDNEIHNLRAIMDEIFGEENSVACLVWEKKNKGAFLSSTVTNIKEYVLVYARSKELSDGLIGEIASGTETYPCINAPNSREIRIIPAGISSKFSKKNYVLAKGSIISVGTMNMLLHSDLVIENGFLKQELRIEGNWRYSQEVMTSYAAKSEIYITQDLYLRRIVTDPRNKTLKDILPRVGISGLPAQPQISIENLFADGWGTNEDANEELRVLMDVQNLLDYPKPITLLEKLMACLRDEEMIVLDFFAGSGTIAHATMKLNLATSGRRKYILVQLPELTKDPSPAYSAGYKTISEIAKERIRRASVTLKNGGNSEDIDLGFRVYKLDRSNLKRWVTQADKNLKELENLFAERVDGLAVGWHEADVLIEIMLLEGFPLDSSIEIDLHFSKNKVWLVFFPTIDHRLFICLDEQIYPETVAALSKHANDTFITLDSALSPNELKISLAETMKVKTL